MSNSGGYYMPLKRGSIPSDITEPRSARSSLTQDAAALRSTIISLRSRRSSWRSSMRHLPRLAGEDALGRLEAAVWAQCDFHIRYGRAWRVAESEWFNLSAADRDRLAVKRARSVEIISEIIGEGAAGGAFDVDEPAATGAAVSTMCGAIGSWYEPGGRHTPRRVTKLYCDLAARMVGADLSSAGRPRNQTVQERRSA